MAGEGDGPLMEVATKADALIAAGGVVFQKWTCPSCGARQTMNKRNTFYMSGHCEECDTVSDIDECGFSLMTGPLAGEIAAIAEEQMADE